MIVNPEVVVTPDYPVVRIREPREKVNLDKEIGRVLQAQGWGIGTYFKVQFISHDRTRLLAAADFLVTGENPQVQTSETSAYQSMTKVVTNREWARVGPWWEAEKEQEAEIKWNPGRQAHEVVCGDDVLASFTKEDGGKAAAEAFLNGEKAA